jgi:hypothetical protein
MVVTTALAVIAIMAAVIVGSYCSHSWDRELCQSGGSMVNVIGGLVAGAKSADGENRTLGSQQFKKWQL